ncbi:MAG TPA: molybdate ABC transporter substrate-binding protein, partial [Gammaproteobacteria bacterium]|nr:molybdate ABC transporter substrate-binding protein [Gammaproteobacteria bacterium]
RIAVASNFTAAVQALKSRFESASGDKVRISTGSTGTLYAQIRHGAPFDAFLAADARRPRLLEQEDRTVPGSRFTYARGRIALWSPNPELVAGQETLSAADFRHLAIANPRTAPYGLAAKQTLQSLGLWAKLQPRIVRGENIAQAHQYTASGTAELGFVALSQISGPNRPDSGSRWLVPADLYDPIRQQAVLLKGAKDMHAAKAFLRFLKGPEAARVMRSFGYGTGS